MPLQSMHICFLLLKYVFMQQSTESQSDQTWQGPLEPVWSNSLLKHHLQPGAKTISSHHFNMCKHGYFPSLSEKPAVMLEHPHNGQLTDVPTTSCVSVCVHCL